MSDEREPHDLTSAAEAQLAPVAEVIEATFTSLARNLTDELARASSDGRASIAELADGIIDDLARIAAERLVAEPLQSLFGTLGSEASGRAAETLFKRSLRNG
jgi:lambda family phage tail tape measure protein